ncbi:unnamed protein product [Darwinula stevensoni]|uniref:Uncharacterized protein n=1 Tax=Darwinula stevensoni TaxID=69355 RepID=A0A7R8X951_9CRUS|nr:unnamed protein product [Darwinula stevensoni]CAG0890754.1 unnamed protein product [Darwinula stevensoni]
MAPLTSSCYNSITMRWCGKMEMEDEEGMELKESNSVFGPFCVISCLKIEEPLPDMPYPMYSATMKNLIICTTAFSREANEDIRQKVEEMSGIYAKQLHEVPVASVSSIETRSKVFINLGIEDPKTRPRGVLDPVPMMAVDTYVLQGAKE